MVQLALDVTNTETKRDPFSCPYLIRTAYGIREGEVLCGYGGRETYTNCHASVAGDPPNCVYEAPDNSPEAVARRKAWLQREESLCTAG